MENIRINQSEEPRKKQSATQLDLFDKEGNPISVASLEPEKNLAPDSAEEKNKNKPNESQPTLTKEEMDELYKPDKDDFLYGRR